MSLTQLSIYFYRGSWFCHSNFSFNNQHDHRCTMSSLLRGGTAVRNKASKLLRGGTVLIHGEKDHVSPQLADVLIEGDRISKIDASIPVPAGCYVIDCTDKVISPGFVDTHHHVWQSPLKGFFGDAALFPYLAIGSCPLNEYGSDQSLTI